MSSLIDSINGVLWNYILVFLLLGAGLYFSFLSRFFQLRRLGWSCKLMLHSRETSDNGISSFQAFCTSLAARVGTGNLAGVAVALYAGGPGAIFWMWMIAILGMATSLVENTLAQLYKTNNHDGTFRGGPAYYIQKALGLRWLGIAFSISLIIAFGFAFNAFQANSIAEAMHTAYGADRMTVGAIIAVVAALVIMGGIRSIARFAELVVPLMALLYLAVALTVVILNISQLPDILLLIFKSAFGIGTAAGGVAGFAIKTAMEQGIKRGLFSNEAGMGSAPNAAATATPNPNHPVTQGAVGMVGVFIDTIVICSATAAVILLAGPIVPPEPGAALEGIAITQQALSLHIGSWGNDFIAVAILLFAFTSIIANYYYGESSLMFLKESKLLLLAYRLLVLATLMVGAVRQLSEVIAVSDLAMGMMALINLCAILLLSKVTLAVIRDYDRQISAGVTPIFDRRRFPFLDRTIDQDVWEEKK